MIFWIASKNFSSWDSGTNREIGGEKYKNMGLWKLTFPSYGAFKGRQAFLFSTRQIFCQNVLCHIVAMIVLKRLRIVTHFCAVSFSVKSLFCGTNNIFYSLENRLWDQTKKWFWKYIKNKGKVISESFRNFAHISSYLHLKSIAWKWDYVISRKLQMSQALSRRL